MMDLLARESEKLALLQASILLLPNSLAVKEFPSLATSLRATHHLELCLRYALAAEVKILVTLAKSLDFTVLTPDLLPAASMLGIVEVEDNTSLVDLLNMLVKALLEAGHRMLDAVILCNHPREFFGRQMCPKKLFIIHLYHTGIQELGKKLWRLCKVDDKV